MLHNQFRCHCGVGNRHAKCIPYDRIGQPQGLDLAFRHPIEGEKISGVGILQLERGAFGSNFPFVQNDHIIGVRRFLHVMGGEEYRYPLFPAKLLHHLPHQAPGLGVQACRPVQQRPGDVDPPTLAAGQAVHGSPQKLLETQQLPKLIQALPEGPACDSI